MSETHISSMGLNSSEVYIPVFPAFLTNSCWLQAVEWQCDEATKRACYSKGKSKVSMRQLFCFNKICMLMSGVSQCISIYLMHFYCLPFWRELSERSLAVIYKQRNKKQYRECEVRRTVTWFFSEMIKNFSVQFAVLSVKHVIYNGLYCHFIFSAVNPE